MAFRENAQDETRDLAAYVKGFADANQTLSSPKRQSGLRSFHGMSAVKVTLAALVDATAEAITGESPLPEAQT